MFHNDFVYMYIVGVPGVLTWPQKWDDGFPWKIAASHWDNKGTLPEREKNTVTKLTLDNKNTIKAVYIIGGTIKMLSMNSEAII